MRTYVITMLTNTIICTFPGRYRVGVHIADVSYFIDEHNALDTAASMRATSVYLVHKVSNYRIQ